MARSMLALPPPLWLAVAALAMGSGEYLVTVRPKLVDLPPGLDNALRPIWAHPAVVLGAIVCLAAGATAFMLAARGAPPPDGCCQTVAVQRHASGRPTRSVLRVLALGLLLWALAIARLATTPLDPAAPWLFLAALLSLTGSLLAHEWHRLRTPFPRLTMVRTTELIVAVALLAVFAYLAIFDLNSWYYSTIGDEHAFFLFAREMALGQNGRSLFTQEGAYGIIPVLSGFAEGLQMHVFGLTGSGWKVATITPAILALAATYGLARTLFNSRVALVALGILASSHYLLAYAHTGYPNLEPLLPGALAPLLFVLGIRRSSILLLILAGVVAALGWYTYYTSRTTIVILAVATVLMVKRRTWVAAAAPLAVGFGLMVFPLFAVSKLDTLNKMFEQTGAGTTTEVAANRAMLPLWNLGRSLLAFNYNTHDGPWLSGSLLDPLSGGLFVLGLIWLVVHWRDARSRLLLAWFVIGLAVTGILSKYDYVSVSRMNFLLPPAAIMGGLAVERIVGLLEQWSSRTVRPVVFPAILAGSIVCAGWGNLQRWFVDTPASVPTSPSSVAIRLVEDPRCQNAPRPPLVVDVGIGGAILPALEAIGPRVWPEFSLYAEPPTWLETADTRCVIFRAPHDAPALTLQRALAARWPQSRTVSECDQSHKVELIAQYPLNGPDPNRASLPCTSG